MHHVRVIVSDAVLAVALLAVLAGGGIVVIDAFVIRRIRREALQRENQELRDEGQR
jgi:hypothetical protein